jgi:hypothetical protein
MYPSYDALIQPLLRDRSGECGAGEPAHTSMPRDNVRLWRVQVAPHRQIMPGRVEGYERKAAV